MTNYERIRAMSIEELAGYITQLDIMNGICLEYERLGCIDRPDDDPIPDEMCLACAVRWLNEEAGEKKSIEKEPAETAAGSSPIEAHPNDSIHKTKPYIG